jgi:DNA (cytosine-5)-methyltransferase 1
MKIKLLDLFSGIGGFHLGLERAGFEVESYFSEIDKYAIQVYQNNFKEAKYVGSVTDVQRGQLPKIDAITFGSPCQDFSLAGKRKGMGGERSSLITEAIRLIRECRPRFFIWENVKGTFSSNNGADFWAIIQAFANIGGYRLEWQLLNTKWFLPQNRERIYLVGYIGNGSGGQVFPIRESSTKNNFLQEESTSTIKKVVIGDFRYDEGYRERKDGNSPTLTLSSGKETSGGVFVGVKEDNSQKVSTDEFNKTINTEYSYQKVNVTIQKNKDKFTEGEPKMMDLHNKSLHDHSPCLVEPHHNNSSLFNGTKIRRLTPIECERLQGFPDNWTQYGTEGLISDSQRYKMCGNAVTVDVVKAVTQNIKNII